MVELYILNTQKIKAYYERDLFDLSEEAQHKASSYRFENDQARSLGASLLIEHFTGKEELKYNEFGKPYKDNSRKFSVSHSGEYVQIDDNDV